MLSSVIVGLVSKYLGEFVELAPEHLSVGLMSGQVNVSGLRFRSEALRDLNLPITVKEGVLGHLSIAIPWTSIWNSPTTVLIEDIFLLAVPKDNVFDEDFETRIQATKERFLQLRELFVNKKEDDNAPEQGSGDTWTSRLVAAIVNNVQVTVNRIHIRFEEEKFAFGISLNSFGALSCDEEFQPKLTSSAGGLVRKLCSMDALSVYLDSDVAPLAYKSTDDFCTQMRNLILDPHHQYILRPLSGKLHATINQQQEPKLRLEAMFDELEVALSDAQFQHASRLGERFSLEARGAPYRRLRPARPASPREMWHFVVGAVKQDLAVRQSVWKWPWIQAMMNDRRDYVHLWCQVKVVGGVDKLPVMDQERLRSLEYRLEYESIVQFRELGELFFERKMVMAKEAMEQAQAEGGWLGRVVWGTPQAEMQRVLEQELPVTGALLQDLNRTLLSRAALRESRDMRDHEGVVANVKLKKICVTLRVWEPKTSSSSDLMVVNLGDIGAHVSIGLSKVFKFDMASLTATEFISVPGVPTMTVSQRAGLLESQPDNGSLLSVGVHLNPPSHPESDIAVELTTQPVDVIFSMIAVDRLARFFTSSESMMLDELIAQASESVSSLQRQVVNQIRGIASGVKTTRLLLKIKVDAPNVVIPSDFRNPDCVRAVAVLGKIRFDSIVVNEAEVVQFQKDGKSHVSMDYFYQRAFDIAVSRIHLMLCHQEDWRSALKNVERSEVLKDFGLKLHISLLTFPTPCLPKLKLVGSVSPIKGFVSAESVVGIMRVLDSITSAASGAPPTPSPPKVAAARPPPPISGRDQLSSFFDTGSPNSESAEEFQLDNFVFDRALLDLGKNPKVMDVSFAVEEIEVLLFKHQPLGGFKDILELRTRNVGLQFDQRRRDLGLKLHLSSLGVADKLSATSQWMLDGMHLPQDEHLLHLSYTGVPRSSPMFKGVDHEIRVKLSNMALSFNRETVLYILNTVEAITSGMSKLKEGSDTIAMTMSASSSSNLPVVVAAGPALVGPTPSVSSLDRTTNLLLKVELGSVTAQLCREQDVLAVLEAKSSDATIDVRCNGTLSIDGSFGWFQLRSPLASAQKWQKVAYTNRSAKGTATFGMETYSPDVEGYPGVDSKVQVQMSTVKVVYRAAFVEEVVAYFSEMESMRSFLFSAAESAVESGTKSASKVALDVTINNPFIKVPRSSASDEYLKLNLGKTTMMTSFEGGFQKLSLGVNQIGASASVLGRPELEVNLLQDIDIALLVQIPSEDSVKEKPTSVMCVVSKVALTVNDQVAELLVGILDGNLTETIAVTVQNEAPPVLSLSSKSKPVVADRVPVASSAAANSTTTSLALVCRLQEVSATLQDIASFHLKGIYFDMKGDEMLLTVDEVLMSDQSPERSLIYNQVVSKRVNPKSRGSFRMAANEPVLRCEVKQNVAKKNMTTVTLNPLRIMLLTHALVKLLDFQGRVVSKLNKALEKLSAKNQAKSVVAVSGLEAPAATAVSAASVDVESTTSIVIKGFEAFAIENLRKKDSRAVVIGFSGSVAVKSSNTGMTVDAEIVDFVLNRIFSMSSGVYAAMVSPWQIGISLNSVRNRLMRIEVLLSHLDITFSHGDYMLIMGIYMDVMHSMYPDRMAYEEMERQKRENSTPAVGKIILEPPRVHKEESVLHLMLEAEPLSLVACEEGSTAARWLSVGLNGTRLCLTGNPSEVWLFDDGKLLMGADQGRAVVFDQAANTVTLQPADSTTCKWVFSDGMIKLASRPDLVLTAVGDWVELRQVEADTCNQVWIMGERLREAASQTAEDRSGELVPRESNPLMIEFLSVVFHGIKARIVDDAIPGQIEPLLSVNFSKLSVFVSSWSDLLRVVLDFSVEADHFDSRLQTWEPLLRGMDASLSSEEDWKCQMTVMQLKNGQKNVDIVAQRIMSFCVTRAMITSFRRLSLIWMATEEDLQKLARREISHLPSSSSLRDLLLKPDAASQEQRARPYVLSNLTGHTIRWSIGAEPPKLLGSEKGQNIAFWSPEDQNFFPTQSSRVNLQQTKHQGRSTLSLFLDDNTVLRSLPIDGARVMCFATHAQKRTLVYEVKYELGSRVLEVRSNVVFLSELSKQSVGLFSSGSLIGDLEPNGMFALPLSFSNAKMAIGGGARLSEETFDQDSLREGAVEQLNGVLKFSQRIRGSGGSIYSILAVGTPDLLIENTFWWNVTVRAPLRVRNLLAVEVFVQLKDSRQKLLVEETRISSGLTHEFFCSAEYASIRYGDHEWSSFVSLKSCNEFTFHSGGEVRVENVSEAASTTRSKDSDAVAFQTLSLWIPFWVVNNTSHKITAQEIPLVPFLESKKMVMYGGSELNLGLFGEKKSREKLSLGSAPATGAISLDVLELGVRVFSAASQFWKTKIVQLDDRFQLVNMCDRRICVGQKDTAQVIFIEPLEQIAFMWHDGSKPKLLRVKLGEDKWLWSGAFEIKEVSLFEVVMKKESGVRCRMLLQTTTDAPVTALIFRPSTSNFSIYRLVNSTRAPIWIRQVGVEREEGEWLNPKENSSFAWPEPSLPQLRVSLSFGKGAL